MRILVTGADGFVGTNLIKKLLKGKENIRILVRNDSKVDLPVETFYGDIRDKNSIKKAFKNIDIVIHLAAIHGDISLQELNETNLNGLKNILELSKENKVKHIIYYSSVAVYGEAININEDSQYHPYDNYGLSKKYGEELIEEYKKDNKINITTIQPAHIYGPGGNSNINNLIKTICKKHFVLFGTGNNLMNVVYISDLIDATIKIIYNKKSHNKKYIITDGRSYKLKDFAYTIATVSNIKKPIKIPYLSAYIIGYIFEIMKKITGKKVPLTRSRVKNITRSRSFIIEKAKKDFAYSPKVTLEEGIKNTYKWLKEEGRL